MPTDEWGILERPRENVFEPATRRTTWNRPNHSYYKDRQRGWVVYVGLEVGDLVLLSTKVEDYHQGWGCRWSDEMDVYIGQPAIVKHLNLDSPHGIQVRPLCMYNMYRGAYYSVSYKSLTPLATR
jgi:hypothetical protein